MSYNKNQYVFNELERHIQKLENKVEVELILIREFIKSIKIFNKLNHSTHKYKEVKK